MEGYRAFQIIRPKMKATYMMIVCFLLIGFFLCWSYFSGYWRFNYPDKDKYPIRGIDVSHHQGKIDWNRLEGQDVCFAYIKATEGGDFKDPAFLYNWKEAARNGLARGAYHFFTFCKPGIEQARNFIDAVPVVHNALPPAIDFEFTGNCRDRPQKEALLKELYVFINEIEEIYGESPVIYVTYESYDRYLNGEIDQYHVWVRDIFGTPQLSDGKGWTFWQYADRGRLIGINGLVDLNVVNGVNKKATEIILKSRANKQSSIPLPI